LEVLQDIWGTELEGIDQLYELSARDQLLRLELLFRRHRHQIAETALSGSPFHLGILLAYLVILEDETDDLAAVFEAVSEGWSKEELKKELIAERGTAYTA
jgi:vacuolar-type H+-ATPase subunit C/Vma6